MIIKATKNHIPFIQKKLIDVENPPKIDLESTWLEILDNPNELVYVDIAKDILGRLSIMPERQDISITWLLPSAKPKFQHFPMLLFLLRKCLMTRPETASWRVWATFSTGRGCLKLFTQFGDGKRFCDEWKQFFPTIATTKETTLNPLAAGPFGIRWEVSGILVNLVKVATNVGIDGT